jgi:two-component system, OmpR family, response regulator
MRILVVDDWPDGAASWVPLLHLFGFEVDAAMNGPQALELARARRPDVGLFDLAMPGMDGCELARQLRLLYPDHLILIAITAHDSEENLCRTRAAGFDLHLRKPAEPQAVLALLNAASGLLKKPG